MEYRISMLGSSGYVIENDEGAFHSAYGFNRWTLVQENASVYSSEEEAQKWIDRLTQVK